MTSLDRRVERLERTAGRDERPTLADLIVAAQDPAATGALPFAPRLYGEDELARIEERSGPLVAALLRCASRGKREAA